MSEKIKKDIEEMVNKTTVTREKSILKARGIVEPFNLWQGRIYKRRKVRKVRKK